MGTSTAELLRQVAALPQTEGFAPNGEDIRIHYRTYGSGPALLFQHGFPDNELSYYHQILEFSKDYTVITPTLRGYPPSSEPLDADRYTIPELVTDIGAVLDCLAIQKALLAGHDWGGVILQAFALFNPERVTALAFLNTPVLAPFINQFHNDEHQRKLSEYTIAYVNYKEGDDKNIDYVVAPINNKEWRERIAKYLEESNMHGMLSYYKKGYPGVPGAPGPDDVAEFVFRVPSLILWGLDDPYFSLAHLSKLWEWFDLSYRFVSIPGAGHWVHQDAPRKVNAELRSWLASLDDPDFS
jgi:epoxide hydrolase 4